MKDIVLVVVILIAVGLSVAVVRFNEKASKAGKSLDEERYSRMIAEESLQKNAAKLATLQEQIKNGQGKMAKIEDILSQEKDINADLKKQYDQLAKAKTALENKLQAVVEDQKVQATKAAVAAPQVPAPDAVQPTSARPAAVKS